jgi:hypothetical protein
MASVTSAMMSLEIASGMSTTESSETVSVASVAASWVLAVGSVGDGVVVDGVGDFGDGVVGDGVVEVGDGAVGDGVGEVGVGTFAGTFRWLPLLTVWVSARRNCTRCR